MNNRRELENKIITTFGEIVSDKTTYKALCAKASEEVDKLYSEMCRWAAEQK